MQVAHVAFGLWDEAGTAGLAALCSGGHVGFVSQSRLALLFAPPGSWTGSLFWKV